MQALSQLSYGPFRYQGSVIRYQKESKWLDPSVVLLLNANS
jgi:hypothetical protein